MFGLGGIFVELLRDVNFRIAPINADYAKEMIMRLKLSRFLTGTEIPRQQTRCPGRNNMQYLTPNHELPRNHRTILKPSYGILEGAKIVDALIIL
jgi:hypothetical protein